MNKPFIENVSRENFSIGLFTNPYENSMAIQITDPDCEFPTTKHPFKIIKQYKFADVENEDGIEYKDAITKEQAQSIAEDLLYALKNNMNVIVHCQMGICRSGAVVEVGEMLGFKSMGRFRAPNLMVKKYLMNYLNWGY